MSTPEPGPPQRLCLLRLLDGGAVTGRGQRLGRLVDVIVRLPAGGYPEVTGLVADVGHRQVFIPAATVGQWGPVGVDLTEARVDLRRFERRPGEVLLRTDVLGHRLVDVAHARLVRAHDLQLLRTLGGWQVAGVNIRRTGWRRHRDNGDGPRYTDWLAFEALIGHQPTAPLRAGLGQLRRLRPAQLADMLEAASATEQADILTQVHPDPELEADVFEELADDRQARLLAARTDADIADVLAHMRPDDAADALAELPQPRRQPVLNLLPPAHREKVTTLLRYHTATAGGLMGLDMLALPAHTSVAAALAALAAATAIQPEALATVYSTDLRGRLTGAVATVRLLQADPAATLHTTAEPDPIRVTTHSDLAGVATTMADFNLLTLPVVDDGDCLVGIITVDDILEACIPPHWRRLQPPAQGDPE